MKKETERGQENDRNLRSSSRFLSYREGDRPDAAPDSLKADNMITMKDVDKKLKIVNSILKNSMKLTISPDAVKTGKYAILYWSSHESFIGGVIKADLNLLEVFNALSEMEARSKSL